MAYGDAVVDHGGAAAVIDMDDRQILNVGALADSDAVDIATDHRAEPDARVSTDDDVTEDVYPVGDIGGFVDFGSFVEVVPDQDSSSPSSVNHTRSRAKS